MVWRVPMSAADATPAEVDPGRGPARGYSWAPFEPGHTVSLRHGAWSPRSIAPVAAELEEGLHATAPWTTGSAFTAARSSWSWTEAQCVLLRAWLDEVGLLDPETFEPRPASVLLNRLETRAMKLRAQLGLDPLSLTKLLAGLSSVNPAAAAGGLDALVAAGAQIRARADEALVDVAATDPTDQEGTTP
jgi:hypothetical protein